MLYRVKDLQKLELAAIDGRIGKVVDLFFDDLVWRIRYFVVNTGGWHSERDVLVAPEAIKTPVIERGVLVTTLTMAQIRASPPVTRHLPVPRQYEEVLHEHYGWKKYWSPAPLDPMVGIYPPSPQAEWESLPKGEQERLERAKQGDPHLGSCAELSGYKIHALDGQIGHLEDFLVDAQTWMIEELIVDTRDWWPGGLVHLAKSMVRTFDWAKREVVMQATKDEIDQAPRLRTGPEQPAPRPSTN